LLQEETVREIVLSILKHPVAIFSFVMSHKNGHSLIEINLDNLENLHGSVTLNDCENVSKALSLALDSRFADENYTLQVSSAGAERELRLPEDLKRFQTLPMRIFYKNEEGKLLDNVFKITSLDSDKVELVTYHGKRFKKKSLTLNLELKNLVKGKLYLDI
jgi:ribosome maturation factor RimP